MLQYLVAVCSLLNKQLREVHVFQFNDIALLCYKGFSPLLTGSDVRPFDKQTNARFYQTQLKSYVRLLT